MPAGRCAACGFLCNPELFGCPDPRRPCPRQRLCYCSQICQERDMESHLAKHHPRHHRVSSPAVAGPPPVEVCTHYLQGRCSFGSACRKSHGDCDLGNRLSPSAVLMATPAMMLAGAPVNYGAGYSIPSRPASAVPVSPMGTLAANLMEGPPMMVMVPDPYSSSDIQFLQDDMVAAAAALEAERVAQAGAKLRPGSDVKKGNASEGLAKERLDPIALVKDALTDTGAAGKPGEKEEPKKDEARVLTDMSAGSDPEKKPPGDDPEDDRVNNPADDRTTRSKKSRLEAKREARKTKKAARKREKLALLSSAKIANAANTEEGEEAVEDKDDGGDPREGEEMADDEEALVSPSEDKETKEADRVEAGEELSSTTTFLADASPRRLTKKEKKREERRLQNIQKKKEKQKIKELEMAEEQKKRKAEALGLLQDGKYLESAVALTKLMSLDPKDGELYAGRRDCHLALGKAKKALDDANMAVSLLEGEGDHGHLVKLLQIQILAGKVREAEETLESLSERSPTAAAVAIEKKRAVAAAQGFDAALKSMEADEWVKALDGIAEVEKTCPQSDALALMRAEAQVHLHLYPDVKAAISKYQLELRDDDHLLYIQNLLEYYTAFWWQEEKKEPRVLEQFRRAASPTSPTPLARRAARMHEKAGAMRTTYKKVRMMLKKDPSSNVPARQTLKAVCAAIDPNNLTFLSEVHRLLASLHDTDEERLRYLTLSLKMRETFGAYLERGNVYRSKRKYQEALSDYDAALRMDSGSSEARRLSEQMRRHISSGHQRDMRRSSAKNDFYSLLGVPYAASTDDIKKAYRKKAKEFHPDKLAAATPQDRLALEVKMKAVNKAFRVLKDPRQRELYDRQRKRSTSSDVDSEFSEEDYEVYDTEDDVDEDEEGAGQDGGDDDDEDGGSEGDQGEEQGTSAGGGVVRGPRRNGAGNELLNDHLLHYFFKIMNDQEQQQKRQQEGRGSGGADSSAPPGVPAGSTTATAAKTPAAIAAAAVAAQVRRGRL